MKKITLFYFLLQAISIISFGQVTLFQNCNYEGVNTTFQVGNYDRVATNLLNNRLAAIRITGSFQINIYENANFRGRKISLNSSNPCLGETGFNFSTTSPFFSLEITEQSGFNQIRNAFYGQVFSNAFFVGQSKTVSYFRSPLLPSSSTPPRFVSSNLLPTINSIKVISGFKAILYQNANFTGRQIEVVGDREMLPFSPASIEYLPYTPLSGFLDMHTHPMSNYGFGREFFYGNIDGDPNDGLRNCNCAHGFVAPVGPFRPTGSCGQQNLIRNFFIDFLDEHPKRAGDSHWDDGWPRQSYTTHQQMWWEWLDRARRGGLKMIVALAQNSHTLADGMETSGPYDDLRSMNDQIRELTAFVGRHTDIMDTVTTSARLRSVVSSGRLAIIIGIEMDNIGNFYSPMERRAGEVYNPNPTIGDVRNEIDRLYALGVRYIFPIHIVNNVMGGAAVYGDDLEPILFNLSNVYTTGRVFNVEPVSTIQTGIGFREPDLSSGIPSEFRGVVDALGHIPGVPLPANVFRISQYSYPTPDNNMGHRNSLGLTPLGRSAIRYMMQKGIMIDIDHMSDKSVSEVLDIAIENKYPLNSGHNGPRGTSGNEKARTDEHYRLIQWMGGTIGIGTGDATPNSIIETYKTVVSKMNGKGISFGTDVHVGAKLPKAPTGIAALTNNVTGLEICCNTGGSTKRWDYTTFNADGMSHYGLFPEFIQSLQNVGLNNYYKNVLFSSVEDFAQMWEKCDRRKRSVR